MKALIFGVSGQDGAYLSRLLLEKGYEVFGASRDAQLASFSNLKALGVHEQVKTISATLSDFRSTLQTVSEVNPDEIYNLAGQSSVALSFRQPVETFESVGVSALNLLEVLRFLKHPAKLYNACSSECFGNTPTPADESTPFRPRSPYAVSRATAFWQVANYREAYGLFACSGILGNHESPLRPKRFVTRKITSAAARIAAGSEEELRLGNLDIERDWGFAGDYVEAMWLMLQQVSPEDFVIATGETYSLKDFLVEAFVGIGKDWRDYVELDETLKRPTDVSVTRCDPSKAWVDLGWASTSSMKNVVRLMLDWDMKKENSNA